MARHILKYVEWEDANGNWFCNDTDDLAGIGSCWYTPARVMKMELVDYVNMLITNFRPDFIKFTDLNGHSVLMYSWKNREKMRKFKNWLNLQMRKANFYVGK